MTHIPNKYDIIADLRRCISSSYSEKGFDDENVLVFLKKAEENIEFLKDQIPENNYKLILQRLAKAKNPLNPSNKRREDLLTASYFF